MSLLGRISTPPAKEATPFEFYFWVDNDRLVELTNLVKVESELLGEKIIYYGIVDSIGRISFVQSISDDVMRFDGNSQNEPPISSKGHYYAKVLVTRIQPQVFLPPKEESPVYLAQGEDIAKVYAFDEIKNKLPVGFLRNGFRGPKARAFVNLDYLDGTNGAHVNVNGITGVATKTSYLLFLLKCFLDEAEKFNLANPSGDKFLFNPIIFNLKGEDLMWIDKNNRNFTSTAGEEFKLLGITPSPFKEVVFKVPRRPSTNKSRESLAPYSRRADSSIVLWSLKEVKELNILEHLFSEDDLRDENFRSALYAVMRFLEEQECTSFSDLLKMLKERSEDGQPLGVFKATFHRFIRRLEMALEECETVISRQFEKGNPVNIKDLKAGQTLVIDLHNLKDRPAKFVVASIIKEIINLKETDPNFENRKFILMVDELNKFAPKTGFRDNPVAELLIDVAQRGRSLGIFLFGAQQMASQVHEAIISNSSLRVLGNTDAVELNNEPYRFLTPTQKEQVMNLEISHLLVKQIGFKQPMLINFPYPPWATRLEEVKEELTDLW